MAAHFVKCLYCGKTFDAKAEDKDIVWVKPRTNRYAHLKCAQEKKESLSDEEKAFNELYQYVKKEQGANFNFVQFKKVTDAWKKEHNYTYSGMLKSLQYFYEVKGNSKEKFKQGSIGIIPFCYVQAYNYYYELYLASKRAGNGAYKTSQREIEIDAPVAKVLPPKLFNWEDEDE